MRKGPQQGPGQPCYRRFGAGSNTRARRDRFVTSPRAAGSAPRSAGGSRRASPSAVVFSPSMPRGLVQPQVRGRVVRRVHRGAAPPRSCAAPRSSPGGYRVSIAPCASARYSRFRETDSLMIWPAIGAITISTNPIAKTISAAGATARVVAAPTADPAPHPRAHEELRHQHDRADEGGHDRARRGCRGRATCESSWPITPSSSTRFISRQQALGDGDRRVLRVAPGRERVRRLLGHDVDPRLRDARRDRESLDDVVQARLLLRRDLAGPGRGEHQPVAGEDTSDRHRERHAERDRRARAARTRRSEPERRTRPRPRNTIAPSDEQARSGACSTRSARTRRLRSRPGPARATGSSMSKNSRVSKPNAFATRFEGNDWIACSAASPGRCRTAARRRSSTRCR